MHFRWFHKMIAFISILTTIQALAVSTKTADLAAQCMKAGMPVANGPFTNMRPTAEDITKIADKLDAFTDSASKDGSLAAMESLLLANKKLFDAPPSEHAMDLAFDRLKAHGYLGTREDVERFLTHPSAATRKAILAEIEKVHLDGFLHNQAKQLRQIATETSLARHNSQLLYTKYHLQLVDFCAVAAFDMDLMGGLAGVAALFGGPANPIADGLTILAGVGAGVWYFGGCDGTGV